MYRFYREPPSNIVIDNSANVTNDKARKQKRKAKHSNHQKAKNIDVVDEFTVSQLSQRNCTHSMWLPAISYTSPPNQCSDDDSVKFKQCDPAPPFSSTQSQLEDSLDSSSVERSTTASDVCSGSHNSLRSLVDSSSASVQSFIDPDDTVTISGMIDTQQYSHYERIPRILNTDQVVSYTSGSCPNSYRRNKMDRCRDQRQTQNIKDNEVHYPSIDKEDRGNNDLMYDDLQYSPSNKNAYGSPQASPRSLTNKTNRIRLPPPKPVQKVLIQSPPEPKFWPKPHPLPPVAQFQLLHKQSEPKRPGIFGQVNRTGLPPSRRYTSNAGRNKRGQSRRSDLSDRDDEDNRTSTFLVSHFAEQNTDIRRKSVQYWQDLKSREQKLRHDKYYLPLLPDLKATGFRRDQRSTQVRVDYDSEQPSSSVNTARSYKGSQTYRIEDMDTAVAEVGQNIRLPKLVIKKSLVMNVSPGDSTDFEAQTKTKKRKKPRRKRKSKESMTTFGYNESDPEF